MSCARQMFSQHHDLVYLAGHFSANDTFAADFAGHRRPRAALDRKNAGSSPTRWCSAPAATPATASSTLEANNPDAAEDWSQRFAQQHALLIGGTGYQYGDSDFLEYSERLYLGSPSGCARARRGADPVAIGRALALAKQDYLRP